VAAELSDLDAPENRFERDQGRLLEVYLPVPTPGGQTLLFETYSRYSSVTANAGAMWRQFVPITVGALLLLTRRHGRRAPRRHRHGRPDRGRRRHRLRLEVPAR
jgi:hypothetical protein